MIHIGQFNTLKVIKTVAFGMYLDGEEWGEILLPNKFIPKDTQLNDEINVFIYFDSEDKIIATTQQPRALVGQCAFLKVIDVNAVGAFLDWGLDKDLLVPRSEQRCFMERNKSYLVYVKQDHQHRIIASSKLDYYLDRSDVQFKPGEEVALLIAESTPLGQKVIINDSHWGLIHNSDIFQKLHYGQKRCGYIKTVREDGKIDVVLRKTGRDNISELSDFILKELENQGGFIALHDKSSALAIQATFGQSKKSFKSAIGLLYKKGQILIEEDGIRSK